jgi:lysophospholipase L1-like esterase
MKKIITCVVVLIVLQLGFNHLFAQNPPFYSDIQAFKKQDSIKFPPANAILLVGSSSFTKWKDVSDYFPGRTIINRAFGGSTLPDVIRYQDDLILPYKPREVVIYCGENDLASSDTVSAQTVIMRAKQLIGYIRKKLPKAYIVFVSLKPSPSRRHLWPKMMAVNNAIRNDYKLSMDVAYVDVYHPMLNADGSVKSEIFLSDSLHMNPKGYAIWKTVLDRYLVKEKTK